MIYTIHDGIESDWMMSIWRRKKNVEESKKKKHGRYKLRAYFKCHEYGMDPNKPLPTIEYWNYFKRKYREIVDEDAEFDETVSPVDGYNFHNGNPPPYYAGHGERGRGLFASRDIKQGELVQDVRI